MNSFVKRQIQRLKNTLWHYPKSVFYNYKYGHPSQKLILIGVTGTDGKTTTSTLIHHILTQSGIKAGLITTNGAYIGDQTVDTGLHMTSPDSSLVQKIFSQMVAHGLTHAVIEVTAHALDQYRYHGCHFEVSALTNTSHEHLDDFLTLNEYILAKSRLFKLSKHSIINSDDQSFLTLSKFIPKESQTTYSINNKSDLTAKNISITDKDLIFTVGKTRIQTDSNYHYQIYNILAALGVAGKLGISPNIVANIVKKFPFVKGRREEIENKLKLRTIIDFAHTPAALESTLASLKKQTKGKLIVIFGATGGRDKTKRPFMGKVVSQIADIAYITSDDTRDEDINNINAQIISGFDNSNSKFHYFNLPNRQEAFNQAVKSAQAGDTIVACGKGHETTILLGKVEYPWSEAEAFRTAFRLRNS